MIVMEAKENGSLVLEKHESNEPFVVLVDGNIGCGKSTFLNHFNKFDDVCLMYEPLKKWQNVGGYNLLDLFYKDPERWVIPTQNYIALTMLEMHMQSTEKKFKLLERSLYSSRYCLIESLYEAGQINEEMRCVLLESHNLLEQNFKINADLIVYIQTSPEAAYDRIRKRARSEEEFIPMEYLQSLHKHHENWLIENKPQSKSIPVPVVVVDGNQHAASMLLEYQKIERMLQLS